MSKTIELPTGIEPLSLDQITPEIRLLASRCILADADSGQFSRDAHKYAAYTIIRERQLLAALAEREQHLGEIASLKGQYQAYREEAKKEYAKYESELSLLRATLESISVAVGHDLVSSRPLLATVMDKLRADAPVEGGWIEIKDGCELPEYGQAVRCVRWGYQEVVVFRCFKGMPSTWEQHNGFRVHGVTHWKVLDWPSLPSKENTND